MSSDARAFSAESRVDEYLSRHKRFLSVYGSTFAVFLNSSNQMQIDHHTPSFDEHPSVLIDANAAEYEVASQICLKLFASNPEEAYKI